MAKVSLKLDLDHQTWSFIAHIMLHFAMYRTFEMQRPRALLLEIQDTVFTLLDTDGHLVLAHQTSLAH